MAPTQTNIDRTASGRQVPLTPSQALFWRGHQLSPDAPIYNTGWKFHLLFNLDTAVFSQAFDDVVRASDALSSVFSEHHGEPYQSISDQSHPGLDRLDLSGEPDPEAALSVWYDGWIAAPFDLARGSYRSCLVHLGPRHWVWCFAQHHITGDAQSGATLLDAVSHRYLQISDGNGDVPVAVPSYYDRVEDWAKQAAPEIASGTPPARQSEAGQPYGAPRTANARSVHVAVPLGDALTDAVAGFAAQPDHRLITPALSLFAAYLTAYAAYLHRVTGDDRITVGVPSHNRLSAADRATIGLFVEVLPLSLTIDDDETMARLHAKVRQAIGDFLRVARPNAVLEVKQTQVTGVLNFVQAKFPDFAHHPIRVEMCTAGAHDAEHGLRLHVMDFDGSGGSALAFDVNTDILNCTTPDRIGAHFTRVLTALVSDPGARLAEIGLCDAEESEAVSRFNTGAPEATADGDLVLTCFRDRVQGHPEAIAITCGGDRLTYGDLDRASDQFAAHLMTEGLGTGSLVAVHMRRSAELVVVLLGILKAGSGFVPISANTPKHRCREIIELAGASAVVADTDCMAHLDGVDVPLIRSDSRGDPGDQTWPDPSGARTAYVLFTSGSTGVPKGVVVDHTGLARYINWAAAEFGGAGPADYALFSSISFDLTITSIFAPLVCGGGIAVYPETTSPDLSVLDVFAEDRVDVVKLTPSHLSLVCEAGHRVSRIRTLVLGGENLSVPLCRRALSEVSADLSIVNEYGPTEAVVGCMSHVFDAGRDTGHSVPIGRPAKGVEISIRDSGLNLSPISLTGEICIGGRLSLGYFGRDDLTTDAFVADPQNPGRTIYRTGDVGRLRSDGVFEYLGRRDRQIKVNGVRIEPAEIEAAVLSAPGVKAAYVRADAKGASASNAPRNCARCGITDTVPGVTFPKGDTCNVCLQFETISDKAQTYFQPTTVLSQKIAEAARRRRGDYDAIMLLSGGKDSTYAAYRLADLTTRVLALTLDNGFLSEEAKANIRRVTEHLGWDHRFMTTQAMNEIFVDSLRTFSNVCNGCFKTVYTLALRVARDEGVPAIVTGLSRGQFFETRLTPDLFAASDPTVEDLEDIVAKARKTYHARDDAIARLLKTSDIVEDGLLDQIEIIDLYRYVDVPVSEIYRFLSDNAPWVRPGDTGRSTNCLINDVGIYVHRLREGFHNYALPYSWDVRMGHKTREQALEELDDEIDETRVRDILRQIGYDGPTEAAGTKLAIVAYAAVTQDADQTAIRDHISARLPREMRPAHLVTMERLPMTDNGKVDTDLLPIPTLTERVSSTPAMAPRTDTERALLRIFEEVLATAGIGVHDDFFDLGGDSLAAIKIAILANESGLALPATAIFTHQTVARLAASLAGHLTDDDPLPDEIEDDLISLDAADFDAIRKALS